MRSIEGQEGLSAASESVEQAERTTATLGRGGRRSGRIAKEVPVMLVGADAAGRQFSETTRTLVLSLHGASVICHHKLIPEQELYLSVTSPAREIEVRVCGQIGEREDGYIYGVAFADTDMDFWRIEFPGSGEAAEQLIPATLECSGCHRQAALLFDATEMDVYIVNEGTLRYCVQCGVATVWRIGTPKAANETAEEVAKTGAENADNKDQAEQEPAVREQPGRGPASTFSKAELKSEPAAAATPVQAIQPNRRRERRTRVKCNACIRVSGWAEETVACEDMSRGGFSFRSEREYPVETMIEAAVPYTPGGISIFVPAQIANVRELPGGKLFRYGAAYIREGKR